jgi:pimeloyl-ACP methyl ester carboxylesterase
MSTSKKSRKSRLLLEGVGALAVAAGAAAMVRAELRNRQALAADDLYHSTLSSPLQGEPVRARSADGTLLYGEVFGGSTGPTVVLIPGWTEELRYFDLLTRGLRDRGFRVVSCDLRGQGQSDPAADGDYRIERYGEDLEAMLVAACEGNPDVIVAGHSMGAMELAAWTGSFPVAPRVRGAALINTGLSELVLASRLLPERLPAAFRTAFGVRFVLGGTMKYAPVSTPVTRALTRYTAFGPSATAGQVAFYEPMLWNTPPKVRAAAGMTMSSLDLLAALEHLHVPALVVAGDVDRMTPVSHAEKIADALPELFELLILPETGHMAPLERPAALADALVRLAAKAGMAPSSVAV